MTERTPEHDQELALEEVEGNDLDEEGVADEKGEAVDTRPEVPEADAIEQAIPAPSDEDQGTEGT